jgi:hypothetical protein
MSSFDYTSRDYLSIRQDILDRASTLLPEWSNRSSSDFGVVMVDLWAYMGDILHYYIDRAAAETFLGTAVNKSSILALANLFDYQPSYQTSSVGSVLLAASDSTHSNTIVIPAGTGFVAPATDNEPLVYFTSTASASMGPSVSSATIQIAEGKYESNESPIQAVTRTTFSNGTAGQRFNIRYTGVIASSVVVYVAEGTTVGGVPTKVQYFYASDLELTTSDSRVFGLEISSDGVAQIVFGNGVNGRIPNNRAEVTVSYRRGQGATGNVVAGRITAFDTGSNILDVSIASSSATGGGSDSESIESMKANIPLMFRTQNRAVSLQDFKDLSLRVPQVTKATCKIVEGSSAPTEVLVYGVPQQSEYLGTAATSIVVPDYVKESIVEYFEPRTMVGASAGAGTSVALTGVNITANIYVKDGSVAYWVASAVSEVIDSFFTFDNVSFDQTLAIGSFYKAIQNVEGVDYVIITAFNTAGSGLETTLSTNPSVVSLFKKGNITLSTTGGVTGIIF